MEAQAEGGGTRLEAKEHQGLPWPPEAGESREGASLCLQSYNRHLDLGLWPSELWERRSPLCLGAQFAVTCHGSPRTPACFAVQTLTLQSWSLNPGATRTWMFG